MSKSIKNYGRCNVGYYVNYLIPGNTQPFQVVGTYAEHTAETPSASYINDDWFKYITTLSATPRPIIDGSSITIAQNQVSIIDDFIIKNYSERCVFSDDFVSWCDYDYKPSNALDLSAPLIFKKIMRSRVQTLFERKRTEYNRLWEIQTSEYNPLIDFDYTEVEKHTGTDTTAHTGTDTTTHSGKDTRQNSGTDTTTRTGSQADSHTGTNTDTDSGTDTSTGFTYAFDSVSEVNKDKNTLSHGKQTQTTYNDTLTSTYNNVADATAHGLKTELTHGEQVDILHGESVGLTHGEKIEIEKHGSNKSPVELMNSHRDFWEKFNILEIIAGDVAGAISV